MSSLVRCPYCKTAVPTIARESTGILTCPRCQGRFRVPRRTPEAIASPVPIGPVIDTPLPPQQPETTPASAPVNTTGGSPLETASPATPPRCPSCGSEQTVRCEMAYLQGTQSGTVAGAALGLGTGGVTIAPLAGRTTVVTGLAQRCAPPPQPDDAGWGCVVVIASIGVVLFLTCKIPWTADSLVAALLFMICGPLILMAASFALIRRVRQKANREREVRLEDWRNTWVCLTCGHMWVRQS